MSELITKKYIIRGGKQNGKKIPKKGIAALLSLALMSGVLFDTPFSSMFENMLVTATAAETITSDITVDGLRYTLYTGFNATDGSPGIGSSVNYTKAVDGDLSSRFIDTSNEPTKYIEFNTDEPIIPKGYIFNLKALNSNKPTGWVLKAKADKEEEEWSTLSSYSGQSLPEGLEFRYACNNPNNTKYKYFRFEAENSLTRNIEFNEIRLYGFEKLTFTQIMQKAATCTEEGILQDCYMRSDGKYFSDENGVNELEVSDVIAQKAPHSGEYHAAAGNTNEYWKCSVCGKYFRDSDCTDEIEEIQTHIVKYLDSDGTMKTLSGNAMKVTNSLKNWSDGWYVLYDDVTVEWRITVEGTVNLILCNGATLTASSGITVGEGATLNIYAQSEDESLMGAITATGSHADNAGIGANSKNCGNITINGGKITATGGKLCCRYRRCFRLLQGEYNYQRRYRYSSRWY